MKLEVLLEKPNNKILNFIFLTSLILFFTFVAIFLPILAIFPQGAGLYDMKRAWTKENMEKVVNIWKDHDLDYYVGLMLYVHFLDGFFMVIYGTGIFTGLLLIARLLSDNEKLQTFYLKLSIFSWLATLLDVIEQINVLIMLSDPTHISAINIFGASLATTLCICVLYPCYGFVIFGFILLPLRYLKNK